MAVKLDIGDPKSKKTFHVETASDAFIGKRIGDSIKGDIVKEFADLSDYEFIITGFSHMSGIPGLKKAQGSTLRKMLLTRGKGMKAKKPQGMRLKKTVHGNTITEQIVQINLKVSKSGEKTLPKVFGKEEVKEEVPKAEVTEDKPIETQ
jgi:small subunit ribosomal protein S6e